MNTLSDILIIGGGIIGLSLAIELRLRGAKVTVLTRDFQQAATHAAAGMLAPQAERIPPSPMLDLCLRSRAIYPDWTRKLEQITGLETGYWPCGILTPVYANDEFLYRDAGERGSGGKVGKKFSHSSTQDSELRTEKRFWLDKETIHQHQPGLSSEVVGGWWYPEDAQVDNRALAQVLWAAAHQLEVNLSEGVEVEKIISQNQRISCVKTSVGEWQAQHYVLATGAWSKELLPVPVYPKKGQMLSVRSLSPSLGLKQVLFGSEIYIVPRGDGRIVIGATSEDVGFTPSNTPAGIQTLLTRAIRLYPELQNFPILEIWWGFRPATPDELPILGSSPYENLTLATGHYRNGILLAPITAFLIADLILNQNRFPLLESFSWERFGNSKH